MGKRRLLKFLMMTVDGAMVYATLMSALGLRYLDFSLWPGDKTRVFVSHFLIIGPFWVLLLYLLDFYRVPPVGDPFYFIYNSVAFLLVSAGLGVFYFYLRPDPGVEPKTILAIHSVLFSGWVFGSRLLLAEALERMGVREKVVLVGPLFGLSPGKVKKRGFEIVERFDFHSLDIKKLKRATEKAGTVVFVSAFLRNKELIKKVFQELPLRIRYLPYTEFYEEVAGKVPLSRLREDWFLKNLSKKERRSERVAKRVFDIVFSIIGLFVFVLLFPFLALAVKLDSRGPLFYNQKRVGRDGKAFTLYKLRSMTVGAEGNGPQWAGEEDPRVTRVGRFLRITHLDECPQFLNILRGELSFVGPRPERPHFVERLKEEIPFYNTRHLIKPGFTGWAQINYRYGSSIRDAEEKLKYDLYYIKNKNLLLDLSIILKTIRIIFKEI